MNATERPRPKVLLVEDDSTLATMLADRLAAEGYAVWHAENAADAETLADQSNPDLMIVDLTLPDSHGLVLCAKLRETQATPIIVCSATTRKEDAIIALKLGADDFIAKPFSVDELLARIEVALRRTPPGSATPPPSEQTVQRFGPLVIDQARCSVTLGAERVGLTPTEYGLLCALASRPDHVISRKELAERVWGTYDSGIGRSLDVHVRRLRAKLSAGTVPAPTLVTMRGFGYQLACEAAPEAAGPVV